MNTVAKSVNNTLTNTTQPCAIILSHPNKVYLKNEDIMW